MRWIINKKRYQIFDFIISVALNVLNITIFSIVLDLFFRVAYARNSGWYRTAVSQMTASDHFFRDKTELIFYTLAGVILALGLFCILILWMFREQQEGKMESQMGIFLASGYQGKIIKRLFFMDGCLDLLLSVSMAYGIFCAVMSKLCENETLRSIYSITGELTWIGISAVLFSGILFMVVLLFHTYIWVRRKKGRAIIELIKGK